MAEIFDFVLYAEASAKLCCSSTDNAEILKQSKYKF